MFLFCPKDVKQALIDARKDQKSKDAKETKDLLERQKERLDREYELKLKDKDAQIELLQKQLDNTKHKVSQAETLEYKSKQQIKANVAIATQISMQMQTFSVAIAKIVGEIQGIKDDAETHHKEIAK